MAEIPYGFCHCGCGEKTKLNPFTARKEGRIKGEPRRYIFGHHAYKKAPEYLEEDHGHDTPCWIWQRTLISREGYGKKIQGGKALQAHRVYYEKAKGAIPDELQIDHLCRIKLCVNPAHLEAVTQEVNVQRGRCARLKPEQVREILAIDRKDATNRALGERYGVNETTISLIRRGKTWRNQRR